MIVPGITGGLLNRGNSRTIVAHVSTPTDPNTDHIEEPGTPETSWGTPQPPQPAQPTAWGPGHLPQPGYGMPGLPPAPPPAPQPGIIPLRPLNLGDILDGAFRAVRHNPKVMLGLSLAVVTVMTVVGVLIGQLLVSPFRNWLTRWLDSSPELYDAFGAAFVNGDAVGWLTQFYAVSVGMGLASALATPIVNGLLTSSVSRSVIGEKATARQVWARVGPRMGVLVGWALLQTLIGILGVTALAALIVLGTIALAGVSGALAAVFAIVTSIGVGILALWLAIRVVLVPPALALENQRLLPTIKRAWNLTDGSWWRLFGITLLTAIIVSVIGQLIAWPLMMAGGLTGVLSGSAAAAGTGLVVTSLIATLITTALSTIFTAAVVSLLYIDLRMRKEGLAVQLAAAATTGHTSG